MKLGWRRGPRITVGHVLNSIAGWREQLARISALTELEEIRRELIHLDGALEQTETTLQDLYKPTDPLKE